LAGGGNPPHPGEISLAHNGVLFLDELPEWSRMALEILREPLESGHIRISRAARSAVFPARFQLVTAMNPCPCGWAGDRSNRCLCTSERIQRYRGRVSGPLLDRIDLHVTVTRLSPEELREGAPAGECSADVRARVIAARERQLQRGALNAHMDSKALRLCAHLSEADQNLLEQAIERLQLSARAMHRILRVARTIADLAGSDGIDTAHLAEAISYRQLDRGA
jgi:magnesium chelatase family protein